MQSSIWGGIRRGSVEASKQLSSRFKIETRGSVGGIALGGDLLDRLCLSIWSCSAHANDAMSSDNEYVGSIANRQLYSGVWKMSLSEG